MELDLLGFIHIFYFIFLYGKEQLGHSAKPLLLCSTEERLSYKFGMRLDILCEILLEGLLCFVFKLKFNTLNSGSA